MGFVLCPQQLQLISKWSSLKPSSLYAKSWLPIILGHAAGLKHSSAKYPIRRIDCKVLSIPRGFGSFNPDNIFLGQIRKRIVLGLVDTKAYNGSYRTNPFYFKHHNLTQVGVYVDENQKPLFLNFDAAGGQNVIAGYQSYSLVLEGFPKIWAIR